VTASSRAGLPAAIVLGIDNVIGLTAVRELGQHNVPIHGLAYSRRSLGLYSRFLTQGYLREENEERAIEQIVRIADKLYAPCLFPVSESEIQFVNRHRARFAGLRVLAPHAEKMAIALDKTLTGELARDVGIRLPRTIEPTEVDDWAADLRFPVVLKWKNPHLIWNRLAANGLSLEKLSYCQTRDELQAKLAVYEPIGAFPLIQEYAKGYGLGQFVFMHDGRALLRFQHRRLHEWPPEGGASTLCEGVPLDEHLELMERSIALLKLMDWEGAAMVEYRYDAATGNATLMEVNGRFWGSIPLAHQSNAPFVWVTYAVLGARVPPGEWIPRWHLRSRFMIPETKRLLRILFQPRKIEDKSLHFDAARELRDYLLEFIRPGSRYYVFSWSDPLPCLADLFFALKRAL
jgi:predicted ATP-grasp superfamily ATP-dependent carboligase